MLEKNDLKSLWEFIYSINEEINETEKHHPIGEAIEKIFKDVPEWGNLEIKIEGQKKGYIPKCTTGHDTIANRIKKGSLNKGIINSIVLYYFYFLSFKDFKEKIPSLNKLKKFFNLVDIKNINKPSETAEIKTLIDTLLIKVELDIWCKIDHEWNLHFFEIDRGIETKLFIDFYKKPNFDNDVLKKIEDYRNFINRKHSKIRLNILNFEIDISTVVQPQLKIIDTDKSIELRKLKEEVGLLKKIDSKDQVRIDELEQKINVLEKYFEQDYNIIKLINAKKDVFIHSPAGTGKSTLLQWLTYAFSNNMFKDDDFLIPIFVELKFYSKSLNNLIERSIDKIELTELKKSTNIILLIDGFDEFKGDVSELLNQIVYFKSKTNCNLVFSGRSIPKFKNKGLHFEIYNIKQMNDDVIYTIFKSVLDVDKAEYYFSHMKNNSDLVHLQTPLFLILFLVYIKSNTSDVGKIKKLLRNKGRFLETIIVDKFIFNYEEERLEKSDHWKIDRNVQIDILSYIGYYLTITNFDSEVISRLKLEKAIIKYISRKHKKYFNTSKIIESLLFNNLLEQFDELISFEKKELRLFFTARHLSLKIKSPNSFEWQKYRFNSHFDVDYHDSWWQIEQYFFGIVNPNILINENKIQFYNNKLLLVTDRSLRYLFYLLEMVDKDNYPITKSNFSKKVLKKVLLTLAKIIHKDRNLLFLIANEFISMIINSLRIKPKIKVIKKLNASNFSFYFSKQDILKALVTYNIDTTFDELMDALSVNSEFAKQQTLDKAFNKMDSEKDLNSKSGFLNRKSSAMLTKTNKINLAYNYIFKKYEFNQKSNSITDATNDIIKRFVKKILAEHIEDFIIFFYSKNPTPTTYQYLFLSKILSYNKYTINSKRLTPELNSKIIDILVLSVIKVTQNNTNLIAFLSNFIEYKINKYLKKQVLDRLLEIVTNDKSNHIDVRRISGMIFTVSRTQHMDYFINYFEKNQNQIETKDNIIIGALSVMGIMFDAIERHNFYTKVNELYLIYLKSNFTSDYLIKIIIGSINVKNPKLTKEILPLISNEYRMFTEEIIEYIGRFEIRKAIPFLIEELENDFSYKAFYNLFLIDVKYHFKYKDKFKIHSVVALVGLDLFSDLVPKKQIQTLKMCLYLGDKKIYEKLKNIDENIIHKTVKITFKRILSRLEDKVKVLEEFENPSN